MSGTTGVLGLTLLSGELDRPHALSVANTNTLVAKILNCCITFIPALVLVTDAFILWMKLGVFS